jgi:tRNA G18 (ribose-2'-O)-methylase SpoU
MHDETSTCCPYLDCLHPFQLPTARLGKAGTCPQCGRPASFRPLASLEQIDLTYERRRQAEALSGKTAPDLSKRSHCALLEDVRSLWNVGSIFRTADGAGISSLFLTGITGCPPRKEIAKTSLGAEESVSWRYCRSAMEILPGLKEAGWLIFGLECTPDSLAFKTYLASTKVRAPVCLVVGNEVNGLSAETMHLCDSICHLPMRGIKESLNVAVAFGIAAYMLADWAPL